MPVDENVAQTETVTYPESRPITPEEQLQIMLQHEADLDKQQDKPTQRDLEVSVFMALHILCLPIQDLSSISQ